MRKARIAQFVGVAAAIPMLMLTTTTSASAASGYDISWHQRATARCLMWKSYSDNTYDVVTTAFCDDVDGRGSGWDDIQQSNGYYTEQVKNVPVCLTEGNSNTTTNGTAPVTPVGCINGDWNQQWDEQWVGNGFRLVNHSSGWCLDADGAGDVYTLPCQSGNNYQVWY